MPDLQEKPNMPKLLALEALSEELCPSAVALGLVDGVHLGHAALLRFTAEEAKKRGLLPPRMLLLITLQRQVW